MTVDDLKSRVSVACAVALAALAMPAAWVGGAAMAMGLLGGGLLALANFRWLVHGAASGGSRPAAAVLAAGFRFLLLSAAFVALVALGAHPLGIVAGLTILPIAVIIQGLRLAHETR
jgi:hypothetical protein